jgi:hypothetical protein
MRGRPKLFKHPRQIATCVEADWYNRLSGEMLNEYRKKNPRANTSDLLRAIVRQAIAEHVGSKPERERILAQRRRELRRLAVACVSATDDKLEQHARKLAALVEAGCPPAA